jgi:histidinol-phosphate aminotransferase
MNERMEAPEIAARAARLSPYTPGEQPRDRSYIKLNTNENPYPPAPGVEQLLHSFRAEELRLYPDPESEELRAQIAAEYGLAPEEVFVGNGSDEVLSLLYYAFFDGGRGPLLFPEHSYSFYPVYCSYYDIPRRQIPMAQDFSVDLEAFAAETGYCGALFPNPNAPTGMALSRAAIAALLRRFDRRRVLAIDEAYADFGAESCVPLLREHPNLLTVHTMSKGRSLAGLRVGFALGNPQLIKTLRTVKNSFNSYPLDRLSQQAATEALKDRDYFRSTARRVMASRDAAAARLREAGWEVLPSQANFLFLRKAGLPGERIYRYLREHGILVRHFSHPGIEEFVRMSIGTEEEMQQLLSRMDDFSYNEA